MVVHVCIVVRSWRVEWARRVGADGVAGLGVCAAAYPSRATDPHRMSAPERPLAQRRRCPPWSIARRPVEPWLVLCSEVVCGSVASKWQVLCVGVAGMLSEVRAVVRRRARITNVCA